MLTSDPDVAFVHELGSFGRMDEGFSRVHALITEPDVSLYSLGHDLEFLQSLSLIAVIGPALGQFAGLPNAQRFPSVLDNVANATVSSIKERVLQLRFQEFTGLVNALVTTQDDDKEEEAVLEIREGDASTQIPVAKIDWIRSAGNHVEIHYGGLSQVHRTEMQTLERRLPSTFLRIHRKVIINLQRLQRIDADTSVRQFATLTTGERFLISRHRRTFVNARLAELRGHSA